MNNLGFQYRVCFISKCCNFSYVYTKLNYIIINTLQTCIINWIYCFCLSHYSRWCAAVAPYFDIKYIGIVMMTGSRDGGGVGSLPLGQSRPSSSSRPAGAASSDRRARPPPMSAPRRRRAARRRRRAAAPRHHPSAPPTRPRPPPQAALPPLYSDLLNTISLKFNSFMVFIY